MRLSDGYMLSVEIDVTPLIRLIKNREYLFGARAYFHVVKGAVEYLTHVRDCVRRRVRVARRRGRKLMAATTWMQEADSCILTFGKLQEEYDRIPKFIGAPYLHFQCSYSVCEYASQMLPQVTRICAKGAEIVHRVKLPQPIDISTGFASRDHTLRAAIARVKDEDGGIIGIWGRAGLGKTHLIKLMEEYFLRDDSFDLVLRVTVPRDSSISKVQREITKNLLLANSDGEQNKAIIFDFLKERNFLLLVDCLWHWLDLEEIGVPSLDQVGSYRRKVVFTTCFSHVCDQMNVEVGSRIEIHCLDPTESLEFWGHNSNIDYFDRLHMFLPRNISRELLGSPLDLIAIGKAMHNKKDAKYWENALGYLSQSCLYETDGSDTEEAAFLRLKFVYDSLTGKLKDCLKSCSLWPEGHIFHKLKLVDFWIGMGLLQGDDIEEYYNEGFSIIANLQELCLLQSAEDGEAVQMQRTIRELVLWIVHNQGNIKNKWAIQCKENWGLAEQVLLSGFKITELPYVPTDQESLTVLILQNNYLEDRSLSNFHSLHSLQYLDLSFNKFSSIPLEICLQVNLRYLNLSHNMIKTLPTELGCLTKLRHLHLRNNPIQVIPNGILPNLQHLKVLDICSFDLLRCPSCVVSFDELDHMNSLQSLGITVGLEFLRTRIGKKTLPIRALSVVSYNNDDDDSTHALFNSAHVNPDRYTKLFELGIYTRKKTISFDSIHSQWNLQHVQKAYLHGYFVNKIKWQRLRPEYIFTSLRRLDIVRCMGLTNISWILHLPFLQDLLLFSCSRLHQIIAATEDGVTVTNTSNEKNESPSIRNTFPRLKRMTLIEAGQLVSICKPTYEFPSLECLQISACPSLKKLPFRTVPSKLKFISGENEWWDGLEWQDYDLQSSFELYFHSFTDDQLLEMYLFNSLQVEWARIDEDFGE